MWKFYLYTFLAALPFLVSSGVMLAGPDVPTTEAGIGFVCGVGMLIGFQLGFCAREHFNEFLRP